MKALICGGRDYSDKRKLYAELDKLKQIHGITHVIHGAARGADSLAGQWAQDNKLKVTEYPAKWDLHGRAAGHIRNQQMLDEGKPDLVIAFPGGVGTQNMIQRSVRAKLKVIKVI